MYNKFTYNLTAFFGDLELECVKLCDNTTGHFFT